MICARMLHLLHVMDQHSIDPFVIFSTVIGKERLDCETLVGKEFWEYLSIAASANDSTVDTMISDFRGCFYGLQRDGMMGVKKVRQEGVNVWKHAKKKMVLEIYLQGLEKGLPQMPSLVQVVYVGKDQTSGARVHQIFKNPQDMLVACRDMFLSQVPPLSILEVPNEVQGTCKFYIDWDMTIDRLPFLGGCVESARRLALQAPAKICQVFVELGYISPETEVQIVIKEGSRAKVVGGGIHKISFHFITNLFGTLGQMRTLSSGLFQYLEKHGGTLSDVLSATDAPIYEIDTMNGYESLIGVDKHPYSNPEQGLAMAFSRKHVRDPYTRFVEILHVRDGVEIESEIPCSMIWIGRKMPKILPTNDLW
jgi:hypothetical protein